MADPFRRAVEEFDGQWPERWDPNPGDLIVGQLVRYDGPIETQYGPGHVAVILDEDSGQERSVWLLETVLVNEFANLAPDPGERVAVKYMGMQEARGGSEYKSYVVRVQREGEGAYNPFRRDPRPQGGGAPPAAAPANPPTSTPQAAIPATAPAQPMAETPQDRLRRLSGEFQAILRKYQVPDWQVEALARAFPRLPDDPEQWEAGHYGEALDKYRERGHGLFPAAVAYMAEQEPADPKLVEHVQELVRNASGRWRLLAQEALETGWQDAVVWARDLLVGEDAEATSGKEEAPQEEPAKDGPAEGMPNLDQPDDDLPFFRREEPW